MSKLNKIKQIYAKYGIVLNESQLKELSDLVQFLVDCSIVNLKKMEKCKEQ
jgi:hypothetical protein